MDSTVFEGAVAVPRLWLWLAMIGLGAFHGLNPGMGWLFAVSRGLQERSRAAVLMAIVPIALGHAAAVAAVVALVAVARPLLALETAQRAGAFALLGFGVFKLVSQAHPRWVSMRVSLRELALWSFLMATAHGAGLMLVPVVLQLHAAHEQVAPAAVVVPPVLAHDHAGHIFPADAAQGATLAAEGIAADLIAVAVHTGAMFVVMAGVAVLVYEKLGLALLRRAWLNLDFVWAWSLIAVGVFSLASL